jgi:hypothetical protein
MAEPLTVYASIGNSDDKLSQARWSDYHARFLALVREHADTVWGSWLSNPADPWQNACAAFEIQGGQRTGALKAELVRLAADFEQESIAWATVVDTEFLGPATGGVLAGPILPAPGPTCTFLPMAGGSQGGTTITVNVHGSLLSEKDLARTVFEQLLRHRRTGPGPTPDAA